MTHAEQIDDEAHALPPSLRDVTGEIRPVCAACRTRLGVRFDAKLPGVMFCSECWELAHQAAPDDPAQAIAAGAEVASMPQDEPWGRTAAYRDPDGNIVGVTQRP